MVRNIDMKNTTEIWLALEALLQAKTKIALDIYMEEGGAKLEDYNQLSNMCHDLMKRLTLIMERQK